MTAKIIPNAFQSPNSYVDAAMELLTGEEYKCLSFAARHILGWQDKINSREGAISLTMFERGFTSAAGDHYGGTGINRMALIKALEALVTYKLLIKVGEPTPEGQRWQLGDAPDWDGLVKRRDQQAEAQRKRTEKATATRRDQRQAAGGTSDVPVRPTYQSQYVPRTDAGTSDVLNQSHIQNQEQNQRDQDAPPRSNIFTLYEQVYGIIPTTRVDDLKDAAKEYPADWIEDAFALTKKNGGRNWNYTRAILEDWRKNGRDPQPRAMPPKAHNAQPFNEGVELDEVQ